MKTTLCLLLALLSGCSVVRVKDTERGASFTALVPAWPWQDSMRAIERVTLSSRTNSFTASVRGFSESETTSTNATQLITDIVGAAVRAALTPK